MYLCNILGQIKSHFPFWDKCSVVKLSVEFETEGVIFRLSFNVEFLVLSFSTLPCSEVRIPLLHIVR